MPAQVINLKGKKYQNMEPIEKLDELDSAFDLLLVLLGIISATLFQFQCTKLPLEIASKVEQEEVFTEVNKQITIWLRILFIPLVLLIGVWFVNRIALRARIRARKSISEFCYIMCIKILVDDIAIFMGAAAFRPMQFMLTAGQFGPLAVLVVVFNILISLGLVYSYEIPFIQRENIRTRKETLTRIWKPILVRTFVLWFASLAIINNILVQSQLLI